jgi:GTP diphosphokinase / guanosine-3',5'-bis(diphosphate) 3'-diphosphatase
MSEPNILVVDDDPLNQRLMDMNLEHLGCRVSLVNNGLEAITALQTHPYDLVLMDLDMPEMDGLDTIRAIRAHGMRHIPIIVCSGYVEEVTISRCKSAGANDYLTKPLQSQELLATLNKWLPPFPVIPTTSPALLFTHADMALILKALQFAAEKHRHQRRKDLLASPYINHPIEVAELLWRQGGITDINVLAAALLHDTLEDTETTVLELEQEFNPDIAALVVEVSDDKQLPALERKRLQIQHAAHISPRAQQIKLADKIRNIHDILHAPPHSWNLQRRREYLDWSAAVVAGLCGCNSALEALYKTTLHHAYAVLGQIKE